MNSLFLTGLAIPLQAVITLIYMIIIPRACQASSISAACYAGEPVPEFSEVLRMNLFLALVAYG